MRLRPGTAADTEALLALWAEAARAAHPFLPGEGRGDRRRAMRETFLPRSTVTVAETDGRPAGFLAMLDAERIGGLFVRPAAQRRGLGRALLGAAGPGRLTAEVYLQNGAALAFWRATGFAEVWRGMDAYASEVVVRVAREPEP